MISFSRKTDIPRLARLSRYSPDVIVGEFARQSPVAWRS
jgi:hypothetical protein